MKGMIKFYNKEKGFGFVVGEDNEEYYFNHSVIPFGKMPNSGDMIEFDTNLNATGKHKNPEIATMNFLQKQQSINANDGKVTCPHCQVRVLPRLTTYYGKAERSLCPLCGGTIRDFTGINLSMPFLIIIAVVTGIMLIIMIASNKTGSTIAGIAFLSFIYAVYYAVKKYKNGKDLNEAIKNRTINS